ncbi:MAG: sterol desaturase family protein [Bacteroidia bacterium]|nr:sterol desaturase family protein [Bacteroidia bacterium]
MSPNYILFAIPFFLGSIFFEFLFGRLKGKSWYNFEDAITNLNIGIGSQAFNTLSKLGLMLVYTWIYNHLAPFQQGQTWLSFVLCVILFDFIFYWAHRWGHEMNFFWGAHIVHHQSQEYNLSVALRQSWIHNLIAFFMFLPIPFLGFDPLIFGGAAAFVTLYQYWIHTRSIKKMGWFEWIFNTPSHHRVHHAINPQYLDKNYAAVFIIWDRMFGTFVEEKEEPEYGTTIPINSWDPVWANVHFYVDLIEGMKREKGLWNKFMLLWKGPEYLGNLLGMDSKLYKNSEGHVDKYQVKPKLNMQIYVFVQFLALMFGIVSFMGHFSELSWFYRIIFFLIIILTTMNCGGIMEGRKWVNRIEILRLIIFLPVYNVLYLTYYSSWVKWVMPISIVLTVGFLTWLAINFVYYKRKNQVIKG